MITLNNVTDSSNKEYEEYNVDIIPGKAMRIYGMQYGKAFNDLFEIGDTVITGRYNLIYTGEIAKITAKRVTTKVSYDSTAKRVTYETFIGRNANLDLNAVSKHNAEESMCI